MPKLSTRQEQILDFLREYHADRSYMPSVREIQAACSISSTSVVDYNLRLLERDGYIRRSPDISRAIELVGEEGPELVEVTMVPVLGAIAAGQPIPVPEASAYAAEDRETVALPPGLTPRNPDGLYALRVKGFSMIDALITDGDIVVLRPTTQANNGDMVVARLKMENETTLKRLYVEGDKVRLQPANSQMEPIYCQAENVEVQGRVVGVIRALV